MPASGRIVNAMTVDVEDYFHVSAFDRIVSRDEWPHLESRVCRNTERLLAMFDEARISATFFVLGWVADRFPALVARINACGHEIASHGFGHRLAYEQTPDAFREDVRRAKGVLEALTDRPVVGYRAPSYSVTERSLWALDVLIEEGHQYDSSILPIHHDRYGIPRAPRHTHTIVRPAGAIVEVPGSTVACGPINLPIAGGGYFRILPYPWTKWGISHLNRHEGMPAVFYVHPWEIDPQQPRLRPGWLGRFRHYRNLEATDARLRRLLQDFAFDTIQTMLANLSGAKVLTAGAVSMPQPG
jgi:polysaccharide deacetylase family protein (PEP-CTERM system associated)